MQVLKAVDPSTATGKTKEVFDFIEQKRKSVPNMIRVLGNSPAILNAYQGFNQAFEETKMPPRLRGLITVTVSEINGCDYTLSTAFALGQRAGVSEQELIAARRAEANDPKTAVALRFAAQVVRQGGHVPVSEVEGLRNAGFTDEEVVEIIALVGLNIFRNYFNLIVRTELDFPLVRASRVA